MSLFQKKICCPYCGDQLTEIPKRKTKCPHCGQMMYVRKGDLYTEEEAKIGDWMIRLEEYGITRDQFDAEREKLTKRFGQKAPVNDTIWGLFNVFINAHPLSRDTQFIYWEMARLMSLEGRDPRPYIEASLKSQLTRLKMQGVNCVKIMAYGMEPDDSTCIECTRLHGKILNIEDALETMPIPRTNINKDRWCRCSYEEA
jgi:hypothetical protein